MSLNFGFTLGSLIPDDDEEDGDYQPDLDEMEDDGGHYENVEAESSQGGATIAGGGDSGDGGDGDGGSDSGDSQASGSITLQQMRFMFMLWRAGRLENPLARNNVHSRGIDRHSANRFPEVPNEKGRVLMGSGDFGSTDPAASPGRLTGKGFKTMPERLLDRELGVEDPVMARLERGRMAQGLIPSGDADMFIQYPAPVYSGQFSDDGNFFFSVVKDFRVRMYDTSNPYNWRYYRTAHYPFGYWTLTDASLSPDNRWLAISSLLPAVCLAPTDPNDRGDPYTLDLSAGNDDEQFSIYSVRFSGDGRELVAGTGDNCIVVFDIESRARLHKIAGHDDDVNAVCFADVNSPHILYSGSDDATIKVWDRRSLSDRRPAGIFVGHINGLTYVDSKGDGRYVLSNGKDHSMKLWDLRKVMSAEAFHRLDPTKFTRESVTDYRYQDFTDDDFFLHPADGSVVTFRGHRVSGTLIRCHFSPPGSTNSRYVYSGSADGKVYVWNLDATLAATLDVGNAIRNVGVEVGRMQRRRRPEPLIREAFWHPNAPLIAVSAWKDRRTGFCSVHSYNESADDEFNPERGRMVDSFLSSNIPLAEYSDFLDTWW